MRPTTSWPGTRGYSMPGHAPTFVNMSLWQTPHASTRSLTWPAAGAGRSRSTSSKGPLADVTCTTRIRAIFSLPGNGLPAAGAAVHGHYAGAFATKA